MCGAGIAIERHFEAEIASTGAAETVQIGGFVYRSKDTRDICTLVLR